MLVCLLPEQVSRLWNNIRAKLIDRMPPITVNGPMELAKVYESLLSGIMQCWSYVDGDKVVGFVLTTVTTDWCTSAKSLLVYAVFSVDTTKKEYFEDAFDTLQRYARSQGCKHITGYTDIPQVIRIVELLGGDTSFTYIKLEV